MCHLGRIQRRKDKGRFSTFYFIVFFYVQGIETSSESHNVLSDYNSRKTSSQSEVNVEGSGGLSSQDGVSQEEEAVPLSLPQLNHLFETSFVRDERSVSNTIVTVIPSQHRVTQQILIHWQPFRDLKLMFAVSCYAEQLSLH